MRGFFRAHRGFALWLAGLAAFYAAYLVLRCSPAATNWLCSRVILPLAQWLGRLCGCTSVSVAEVLILTAAFGAVLYLAWQVRCLVCRPRRGRRLCRMGMTLLCTGLTIYAGYCLMWGSFYGADGFQEKSGLTARGGTVAELTALTERFARQVSGLADRVPRDEDGCFAVPRQEIFDASLAAYDGVVDIFPCLTKPQTAPKAFVSSRVLSSMGFSGFYFPFTGEANLNDESTAAYLPTNICHELAHQQGIASEQECNFVAVVAATTADSDIYRYSGSLVGYIYLANALYRVDRAAWQTIRDSLPDTVQADIRANNAYWAQFDGPVKTVSNTVYDGFLKSHGLADGILNYGTAADLLLAYYCGEG